MHALPEHTTSMRAALGQGMAALTLGIGRLSARLIIGADIWNFDVQSASALFFLKSNGPISRNQLKTRLFRLRYSCAALALMPLVSPALSHLWRHLIG